MAKRTQLALCALLLLQVVLIVLLRTPLFGQSRSSAAHALLPGLTATSIARLELQSPAGEKLTLTKNDERWVVQEAGGFPAQADKVKKLLDDLRGLHARRPVVSSSRYHKAFKVTENEFEARVRGWEANGTDPKLDLILGSSSNYRSAHVRLAGEDAVYEVRDLAVYDLRPDKALWIDKTLVDLPAAEVLGLQLTNAKGSLELEKQDGVWKLRSPADMQQSEIDTEKVDALLRSATSIRLSDAAGPLDEQAQGLALPAATLTLKHQRAQTPPSEEAPQATVTEELVVRIGAKVAGKENERYITRSGLDYAGTVWESSVSRLLEQEPAELLKTSGT